MLAKIKKISYYLPNYIEDNNILQSQNPEWDMEKISNKTGVLKRHIAKDDKETTTTMAIKASEKMNGFENLKQQIESVILVTQTPEYHLPTSACIIQDKLGLEKKCMTFDINLGCSGYIYGLSIAGSLIESKIIKNCLLICSEKYTSYINKSDRTTRTLFSDGAASTYITSSDNNDFQDFEFGTDGSGYDKLIVPKINCEINKQIIEKNNLYMSGADIFTFTISTIPNLVNNLLKKNKLSLIDIDLFVFHQASKLVLETMQKKLNISNEKIFNNFSEIGNTVSASIPIALKDAVDKGHLKNGYKVMLIGFGVGLSWGASIINWQYSDKV